MAGPKLRPVATSMNSAAMGDKYWPKKELNPPRRFSWKKKQRADDGNTTHKATHMFVH